MATRIKIRSGTRAALNAAAAASELIQFEPLFITDEQRFAVATATNAYSAAGKQGEGGSGGFQYTISATAPDPEVYPFWFNLGGEQFVWDGEFWFQVSGGMPEHGHTAAEITDFASAVRAQVEATLTEGSGVNITPAGSGGTRTLAISAGSSSTSQSPILSWAI